MLWFALSLATALLVAVRDVSVKFYRDLGAAEAAVLEHTLLATILKLAVV